MRLFEIDDDFSNQASQTSTIEYLYKVQAARSHELYLYYQQLQKKHPEWQSLLFDMENEPSNQCTSPTKFEKNIAGSGILTLDEIIKITNLYCLMHKAKKTYEYAGGEYKEETNS